MTPSETPRNLAARKDDHIRICRELDVEGCHKVSSNFRLAPAAFPEMDINDVQTESTFLDRRFSLPLLVTGMTGGVEHGQRINEVLAAAAQNFGIPMGLGSQKMMIADSKTSSLFQLRTVAPRAFLIGNIGAVSFNYGIKVDDILKLVDSCELNAFAVHVNALQECIQPEGERNFRNLFGMIAELVRRLPVPVLVKEVGAGMDATSALRLADAGVSAIDIGGRGGTSWSFIEGQRGDAMTRRLGDLFRDWGRTTEDSLELCVRALREKKYVTTCIATGGVRDGEQVAKLVGLGAAAAGVGLPLFRAAVAAIEAGDTDKAYRDVCTEIEFFKRSLTIAMFCSGAKKMEDLPARLEKIKGTHNEF